MFYSNVSTDLNQGVSVNNDYRQLGIIKNPNIYGSDQRFQGIIGSGCFIVQAGINTTQFPKDTDVTVTRTRSYRNNNPGNLDYQADFKTIDPKVIVETMLDGTKGRYAEFSEPGFGSKALIDKKIIKWANGGMPITGGNSALIVNAKGGEKYIKGEKPTVAQFFYTYAPPNENKTEEYIKGFIDSIKKTKPNTTRKTKVSDLLK
jgi:hypothetical protein